MPHAGERLGEASNPGPRVYRIVILMRLFHELVAYTAQSVAMQGFELSEQAQPRPTCAYGSGTTPSGKASRLALWGLVQLGGSSLSTHLGAGSALQEWSVHGTALAGALQTVSGPASDNFD
eukprot:6479685-Amphidinium_carterae.1